MQQEVLALNLVTPSGRINPNVGVILAKNPGIESRIEQATSFLVGDPPIQERLFAINTSLTSQPLCQACRCPVRFNRAAKCFPTYCSTKCGATSPARRLVVSSRDQAAINQKISKTKQQTSSEDRRAAEAKRASTVKQRYGVSNPWKSGMFDDKRAQTNTVRYGVVHASTNRGVRDLISSNHARRLSIPELDDVATLVRLNHTQRMTLQDIANMFGVSKHVVWTRYQAADVSVQHHFRSNPQTIVEGWLMDAGVIFVSNDRSVLGGRELDIVVADANLAIEVNGVYWHSELNGKPSHYHISKTLQCLHRGYTLLHLLDIEILRKPDVVHSMLMHRLGRSRRTVGARKCVIDSVSPRDAFAFCEKNHIQGGVYGSSYLGLRYESELVAVMIVGRSRFERGQMELLRYCTSLYHNIPGGFTRLLARAVDGLDTLITYSDKRFGVGAVYNANDFTYVHDTPPSYDYFHRSQPHKLQSRHAFQKHKLSQVLSSYDPSLSEWDNMRANGYDRIWGCGNSKFVWTRKKPN